MQFVFNVASRLQNCLRFDPPRSSKTGQSKLTHTYTERLQTDVAKPLAIRMNNGPEYISATLQNWTEKTGIALMNIQLGGPPISSATTARSELNGWADIT